MSNQKRIEEVAREIWAHLQCWPNVRDSHPNVRDSQTEFVKYFNEVAKSIESEFQSPPKSEWVECSERMPETHNQIVAMYVDNSNEFTCLQEIVEVGSLKEFVAWYHVPPYVPPESKLLKKYKTFLDANKDERGMIEVEKAIKMFKMSEKEIADGK